MSGSKLFVQQYDVLRSYTPRELMLAYLRRILFMSSESNGAEAMVHEPGCQTSFLLSGSSVDSYEHFFATRQKVEARIWPLE